MPPKQKTDRKKIIETAFSIVRKMGIEHLNARAIAERLEISTQPIFSNFKNMEELKDEVRTLASKVYFDRLKREVEEGKYPPLKARGMGYVKFAMEDGNLFKFLFMNKRREGKAFPTDDITEEMRLIESSLSLRVDESKRIHALLWFSVHGIASLIVTESLSLTEDEISTALTDIYEGLKLRFENE